MEGTAGVGGVITTGMGSLDPDETAAGIDSVNGVLAVAGMSLCLLSL